MRSAYSAVSERHLLLRCRIVGAIPEWLDLISHRTERIRFMKKEEQRLAKSTKPE